ncbi:MAG: LolA-related protein [Lysobacteraceae bacterium]
MPTKILPPTSLLRRIVPSSLALSLILFAAPICAQSADSGWILQALARPAPMRTAFVEVRDSPLLKQPLRLSGEYRRPSDDTLIREVHAPYRETTTLRAGEASIARDGKPPRTFSLSRVPELAGLQSSFGALLAGDRARIERVYRIDAQGDRAHWTLTLAPKDKALAARVRDIVLYGQGAELRCIETRPVKGELQRTLLASAALAVKAGTDANALQALCRNGVK